MPTQCENYGNLPSHLFDKNFVKVTLLLKKILKTWFDENFSWMASDSKFLIFPHCVAHLLQLLSQWTKKDHHFSSIPLEVLPFLSMQKTLTWILHRCTRWESEITYVTYVHIPMPKRDYSQIFTIVLNGCILFSFMNLLYWALIFSSESTRMCWECNFHNFHKFV